MFSCLVYKSLLSVEYGHFGHEYLRLGVVGVDELLLFVDDEGGSADGVMVYADGLDCAGGTMPFVGNIGPLIKSSSCNLQFDVICFKKIQNYRFI